MALAFLIVGYLLMAAGVASWNFSAGLVFAGAVLFVAGGLELRRTQPPPDRRPDR